MIRKPQTWPVFRVERTSSAYQQKTGNDPLADVLSRRRSQRGFCRRERSFRSPVLAVSYRRHGVDVSGGNSLVWFYRQRELKDGAPRFICASPHPSAVRLNDRMADG